MDLVVGKVVPLKNRMISPEHDKDVHALAEFIRKYARHSVDCDIRRHGKCDCGFFEERERLPKGAYVTR
jgi:hypothetical protein